MPYIISDCRLPHAAQLFLKSHLFHLFCLPPDKRLSSAIESHTDMLMFTAGKDAIVSYDYYINNKELFSAIAAQTGLNLAFTEKAPSQSYPHDAILNALVIGDKIFLRKKSIAEEIIRYAEMQGLDIVNVNQGYPACTVLPLGNSSAITADSGMYTALVRSGIKTTLISDSEKILLPPYRHGFIGGCAGVYRDTVYFAGELEAHEEADKIKSAILEAGLKHQSVMPGCDRLFDLGGLRFFD